MKLRSMPSTGQKTRVDRFKLTCSMVDLTLLEYDSFIPASQLKDSDAYDLSSSQNSIPTSPGVSDSPVPWDLWQPFELTDNYSEPSTDDTIGMGWTARYAKKGIETVCSDFTEDVTDEEEYGTRLLRQD